MGEGVGLNILIIDHKGEGILIITEYELQYPLRSLLRKTFFQKFLNFFFQYKD